MAHDDSTKHHPSAMPHNPHPHQSISDLSSPARGDGDGGVSNHPQFDIMGEPIEMTFAEIDAQDQNQDHQPDQHHHHDYHPDHHQDSHQDHTHPPMSDTDLRRQQRVSRINAIFAWQFYQDESIKKLIAANSESDHANLGHMAQSAQFMPARDIIAHVDQLDEIILKYAPKHSLLTFNKIDLAILRQGLYELLYTHTPTAVVIDEAVEIAKQLGSEEAPNFVHGVLGNYVDDKGKN